MFLRMNSNDMAKKIMENTSMGRRKIRRLRSRWADSVLEGIRILRLPNGGCC